MMAANLSVGDTFIVTVMDQPITVEVLRPQEPYEDRFGRRQFKYWCRRHDTGTEGWMIFGPLGEVVPT